MATKKDTNKKAKAKMTKTTVVNKKSKVKKVTNLKEKNQYKKNIINKFIPRETTEIILTSVFLVLLIMVIILSLKALQLKKEADIKKEVDLIIPVLESETNNTFSVDLSEMKSEEIKEYKFMVTNYKDKNIATEEVNYEIELTQNSDAVTIKLYRDKEDKNLLTADSNTHNIQDNKLSKSKKDSDTYYLIIRATDEIEEKDNISIKITGIN